MRYRLAIFDFDGTLHDSFPWFLRVLNDVAERHGIRRVGDDEVGILRGKDTRGIITHMGVPAWKIPLIARDMRRLKSQHLDEIPLFPKAGETLAHLRERGVVTAIVSSDSEANVRRALGPEYVGHVTHFGCGASLFGKARKLRQVLKASGISARDAIKIGDETRDHDAAMKAGIAFGAVTWGYADKQLLVAHRPDVVFDSFSDIVAHVG